MNYKIETPNKLYKGVTEGVPFSQGTGYTDNKNVRNVLVNDYGYKDVTETVPKEPTGSLNNEGEFSGDLNVEDINIEELTVPQLKEVANQLELSNFSRLTKDELIELITNAKEDNA